MYIIRKIETGKYLIFFIFTYNNTVSDLILLMLEVFFGGHLDRYGRHNFKKHIFI